MCILGEWLVNGVVSVVCGLWRECVPPFMLPDVLIDCKPVDNTFIYTLTPVQHTRFARLQKSQP